MSNKKKFKYKKIVLNLLRTFKKQKKKKWKSTSMRNVTRFLSNINDIFFENKMCAERSKLKYLS